MNSQWYERGAHMRQKAFEINFDGLVGPTHNYAGLAYGNLAAMRHESTVSNPRAAFLQGLAKCKLLVDLGLEQGLLPPQERPYTGALRRLGFRGTDTDVLAAAAREAPDILAACYSSSSMWAANAATISPSSDTADGLVHFTPANLISNYHRSIETAFTSQVLQTIFNDRGAFLHHPPLPAAMQFSDEGAANHVRLCRKHNESGLEVFVYGRSAFDFSEHFPQKFPARQTSKASEAIIRRHGLASSQTVLARQNASAIDAGVFHNDVIAVGNENVFFCHSGAYADSPSVLDELRRKFHDITGSELIVIEIQPQEISVQESVETYLFNSQLVTLPSGNMCLIAPSECMENVKTRALLERIIAQSDNPIDAIHYVNIRQSMKNGGGPACLRLRIVLTETEKALSHQGVYLNSHLCAQLEAWATRHYRDRLSPEDLADPALVRESRTALDELSQILGLGSIYSFQRA
jgi:succinylarginine dihydrolase